MSDLFFGLLLILVFLGIPASIFLTIFFSIKKKGFSIFKISIPITLAAIIVSFIMFGVTAPPTEDNEPQNQVVENAEEEKQDIDKEEGKQKEESKKKEEAISLPKEEPKNEFVKDGVKITYKSHKVSGGNIIVYYDMTNNSKENKCFNYCFDVKGWQDGIELETNYLYDCDEEKNTSKEIKPGATITVASVFELSNSTSDVEIEFQPWISFIDEVVFELKLSIN